MGLLLAAALGLDQRHQQQNERSASGPPYKGAHAEQPLGGVVGAPLVLSAVGFTAAGIAAGSLATKMMSAAAIANGGGVAAGSLVALAQAAGAAGLSAVANTGIAATGAVVGLLI